MTLPKTKKKERIDWHSAFYDAIRQELAEYSDILHFEREHQLNYEPFRIDVLIIKKHAEVTINKNIAKIFRGCNIFEYKNPKETMGIKEFYKLYGYACLYFSIHDISLLDITLTMVGTRNPRKLINHLRKQRGYRINETGSGVYEVEGDIFPIQIIESKKLPKDENIWLESLRDDLKIEGITKILEIRENTYPTASIQAYLYALVTANFGTIEEMKNMDKKSFLEMISGLELVDEIKEEGREEGIELSVKIIYELIKQTPVVDIAEMYKTSVQKVDQLRTAMMQESA